MSSIIFDHLHELGYDLFYKKDDVYKKNIIGGSHSSDSVILKATQIATKNPVVLKLFFTKSFLKIDNKDLDEERDSISTDNQALIYEKDIYMKVSTIPELTNNIIHFIEFVEVDLSIHRGEGIYSIQKEIIEYCWGSLYGHNEHPRLTPEMFRLNIIVTAFVQGDILWNYINADPIYTSDAIFIPILFQIIWGIQVLQKHGIQHNDMHAGNVYIVPSRSHDEEREYTDIEGTVYILPAEAPHVLFFDWDFANSIDEPGPKASDPYYCTGYGVCGVLNERRDLYRALHQFLKTHYPVSRQMRNFLESIFEDAPGTQSLNFRINPTTKSYEKGYPCNVNPHDSTKCLPYLPDEPKEIMDSKTLLKQPIFSSLIKGKKNPFIHNKEPQTTLLPMKNPFEKPRKSKKLKNIKNEIYI